MDAGPQAFGKYTLHRLVDETAMFEIFDASVRGGGAVTLKRVPETLTADRMFIENLKDGVRVAALLHHPNIEQIYEFGELGDHAYIACEYTSSVSLRGLLASMRRSGRRLSIGAATYITCEIADALDHAHRTTHRGQPLRLVHRDISPRSVLVDGQGTIKVCDFAMAVPEMNIVTTRSRGKRSKISFWSPEQVHGRVVDGRGDIFALGALLWEMLTGRRLFLGGDFMTVLARVAEAKVGPPSAQNPEVPVALDRIVQRALSREPDDRHGWARELYDDLGPFTDRARAQHELSSLGRYQSEGGRG